MSIAGPHAAPSGEQYEIAHGDQRAVIVEVGGGVRSFTHGDRRVLQEYAASDMCDGAHGCPLIPWPNRLADGRYRFNDTDYQVALSEPEKHNAIHGFLRWRSWQPVDHGDDRVTMTTTLHPLQGYPFTLAVQVRYLLDDAGLTVTTTVRNVGASTAPYGWGQHPYLSPGDGLVDDCTLQFDAATRILTDDRQLPSGTEPVAGTPFDFRSARRLGTLAIDFAFTDLIRDDNGRAGVRLAAPDGWTATTWVDESCPVLEIYTADTLQPARRRRGLGTEPMTLPPNGLQSQQGVIRLEPGDEHVTQWGANLQRS